jgi:hypothetical protein
VDQQVLNLIQKILDRVMGKTQNILQPAETMHENLVEGKVNNLQGIQSFLSVF